MTFNLKRCKNIVGPKVLFLEELCACFKNHHLFFILEKIDRLDFLDKNSLNQLKKITGWHF